MRSLVCNKLSANVKFRTIVGRLVLKITPYYLLSLLYSLGHSDLKNLKSRKREDHRGLNLALNRVGGFHSNE